MNTDRYNWHRRPASGVLIPGRFAEGQEVVVPLGRVSGRFGLEKRNAYGRVTGSMQFSNLVTHKGLDDLGTLANASVVVAVGVGTSTPAITDTALQAQVTKGSSGLAWLSNTPASGPTVAGYETGSYTFPLGAINANLTEVGLVTVGGAVTSGIAGARALVVDGAGNPVAFPVTSDEQLTVTYTRGSYTLPAPLAVTQVISGVTYDATVYPLTMRPASGVSTSTIFTMNAMNADTVDSTPVWGSGTPGTSGAFSSATYGVGNFYRDYSATWGAGVATGTLYRVFLVGNAGACNFCVKYTQPLVKGSGMLLTLPFRISWGAA